ncbi:MAG: 3D domain-containing protein [Desulfobacter sp.]|nr:MAG: 3D domain-containing protein [Desulfobacter sp.]
MIFNKRTKRLAAGSLAGLAAIFLMGTGYIGDPAGKGTPPGTAVPSGPAISYAPPVLHPVVRPTLRIYPVLIVHDTSDCPHRNRFIQPLLSYIETRALREVTAYNAGDFNQCDGDPCISASGENICLALEKGEKRCAANFVPLGTRIWIEGFGECLVTDRMHHRFSNRVDIAMPLEKKQQALAFGRQTREVKIISRM